MISKCTVCGSAEIRPFLEIRNVPIFCNVQWATQAEAREAAVGNLDLGFCGNCGNIFNLSFDPSAAEYSTAYENSLHFSPHFQKHAEKLASRLKEKYELESKSIIEIGCGKGEFISMLCADGRNKGYGFDASYESDRELVVSSSSVEFFKDYYDERHTDLKADFVCCRHVLEHIQYPVEFLKGIRSALGDSDVVVYFEMPNAHYSIDDMGIWDFIYEHCSYFCAESACYAFSEAGFEVIDCYTDFNEQFLCIEAIPTSVDAGRQNVPRDLQRLSDRITEFSKLYLEKIDFWNQKLNTDTENDERILLWGGGSKGVTFLNALESTDNVVAVVDVNPNKHGMYVGGTGHRIIGPDEVAEVSPDTIIIMNSIYEKEIENTLISLDVDATLLCA